MRNYLTELSVCRPKGAHISEGSNMRKNKIMVPSNHLPCTIYYVPFAGRIYFQAN